MKPVPHRRCSNRHSRSGLASLEFVLTLPLVVVVFFLCFVVFGAFQRKLELLHTSRKEAFQQRSETQPRVLLQMGAPSLDGTAVSHQEAELDFIGDSRTDVVAEAQTKTLAGTWDHETIAFPQQPQLQPHVRVARLLESDLRTSGAVGETIKLTAATLNMGEMPTVAPLAWIAAGHFPLVDVESELLRPVAVTLRMVQRVVSELLNWFRLPRSLRRLLRHALDLLPIGLEAISLLVDATDGDRIE